MITQEAQKAIVLSMQANTRPRFEAFLSKNDITLTQLESDWYQKVIRNRLSDIVREVAYQPENERMSDPFVVEYNGLPPSFKPDDDASATDGNASSQKIRITHHVDLQRYAMEFDVGTSARFEYSYFIGCIPALDRMYIRHGNVRPEDYIWQNEEVTDER